MPNRNAVDLAQAHGFTLDSVCWGYRDIFGRALQDLVDQGAIGSENPETTSRLFSMLKQADRSCYDHVLKEFLTALNPETRWLLALPGIFSEVVDLGRRLSEEKIYYGTTFFQLLGEAKLGRTPAEMRHFVTISARLFERDPEAALAFARGFAHVRDRLTADEIDIFALRGEGFLDRDREMALSFLSCTSKAAENVIRTLTQECRLEDYSSQMSALLRALAGYEVDVENLGSLDSDELIERGTTFVCMSRWCYVPAVVRAFPSVTRNRDWYRLLTIVAAGMLEGKSLPLIQGEPGYHDVTDVAGDDMVRQNLLTVLEYARIIRRIRAQWPGAVRLLDFAFRVDAEVNPAVAAPDRLLRELLRDEDDHPALRQILGQSVNVLDTADAITPALREQYDSLGVGPIRSYAFLPDFFYPAEVSLPPAESMAADLHDEAQAAKARREGDDEERAEEARGVPDDEAQDEEESEREGKTPAAYIYDEWDNTQREYRDGFCKLHEHVPEPLGGGELDADVAEQSRRVRRIFERIKPELARKEKYLEEGDEINVDILYDYLMDRQHEPSPRIRFYERPRIQQRDLAVLILLDMSGSTSGSHGNQKVVDLEKNATIILAEALSSLGDRFEVGGFRSRGPEYCEFLLFKQLHEVWDADAVRRLDRAKPADSTRMGVALRHAGWRLSSVEAKQRLIIVITDGKPMDDRYSPDTRYAQFDVRMACDENDRQGIHTFAISTEENTVADMEIMFPHHRFAILGDMRDLPRILPQLYVRLTA